MRQLSIVGTTAVLARTLASVLHCARAWLATLCRHSINVVDGRLVFAEKTFSINQPINLTARLDQAYHDGIAMTLVEFKTRYTEQIYTSDIIELSAQRLAVHYSTGERVYDFGYIVLQHPMTRRRTTFKVFLLSQEDVIGIAERQRLLIGRALVPRHASDPGCCRRCEYKSECRTFTPHTYRLTD